MIYRSDVQFPSAPGTTGDIVLTPISILSQGEFVGPVSIGFIGLSRARFSLSATMRTLGEAVWTQLQACAHAGHVMAAGLGISVREGPKWVVQDHTGALLR